MADLAASHRGLYAPILPIEGARMCAPGISTGACGRFCAFQRPARAGVPRAAVAWSRDSRAGAGPVRVPAADLPVAIVVSIYTYLFAARVADLCRRLAHRFDPPAVLEGLSKQVWRPGFEPRLRRSLLGKAIHY